MDEKIKGNDSDKERFIDVLLVVVSLILAGSSSSNMENNPLFYFSVFAFLTFAITTRAMMTLIKNMGLSAYNPAHFITSSIMAVSFPLIFVSYFYSKVASEFVISSRFIIFISCVFIIFALASLILVSLIDIHSFINYIRKSINFPRVEYKRKYWIYYWVITLITIGILGTLVWFSFMGDTIQSSENISHNVSVTKEDVSLGKIFSISSELVAAFLAGIFTLLAVYFQEGLKKRHQKKCIATGLYYEIKALEEKITQLLGIFDKFATSEEGITPAILDSPYALGKKIKDSNIDLNYKPLYSTSGLYYQFIKEIYVFEDELIENILRFYNNLFAADDFYIFFSNHIKREEINDARNAAKGFAKSIHKSHKVLPDLTKGLEKYVTTTNSPPTPESACTTTQPSEKDAEQ